MKRWLVVAFAALLALPVLAQGGERHWTTEDGHRVVVVDNDDDLKWVGETGEGGYLGVTLADLDDEDGGKGARIRSVFDDTPAEAAGLEAGDIVTEFDGQAIADAAALSAKVRAHDPGDKVKLKAERDGKTKTFEVTLGKRETTLRLGEGGDWHMNFAPEGLNWLSMVGEGAGGRLGVEVRDLEGPLAGYFPGTEGGALVLGVDEDSPAAEAGIEPGDVIVGLGGETVADVADLRAAVSAIAGDEPGELRYVRKGKANTARVEIPEAKSLAFMRQMGEDGPQPHRIIRRLDAGRERLEEKLERLEERLEELEQRLSKGGDRRG